MAYKLGKILISRDKIHERVTEVAKQIANDFDNDQPLVFVGILTGAAFFLTDLVREMPENMNVQVDFMSVASYGDSDKSSGVVRIYHDLKSSIEGKNVIIVEDIVDTGLTLSHLKKLLLDRHPASLKICALLDKQARRETDIKPDYCCFSIPDEFVVGYGLDYASKWRHLKDVKAVVDE